MKLSVYVLGREVAVLESIGDFKSVLTYIPNTGVEDFVSLTMPVRTESYTWDDQLPPSFADESGGGIPAPGASGAIRSPYRGEPHGPPICDWPEYGGTHSGSCSRC